MLRTGDSICKREVGHLKVICISSRDIHGRIVHKFAYAKTYNAAREGCTAVQKQLPSEVGRSSRFFQVLLNEWLYMKQSIVKPSTYIKYRNTISVRIAPKLGEYDFMQITPQQLDTFYRELLTDGLSASSVRGIATILRGVIKYAQENGAMKGFSFNNLRLPKTVRAAKIFSVADQKCLTQYLSSSPTRSNCGILLSLYLGLRIGELCALKCRDIQMKDEVLSVTATLQRLQCIMPSERKTQITVTQPKSNSSIRRIPIQKSLLEIISPHLHSQNAYFLSGSGEPIDPRVVENRFRAALSECGIEQMNFHALRHTFATRCVEHGCYIKALSEILGHSSVKITLDKYVHPSDEQKKRCMNLLSDLVHSSSQVFVDI